MATSNPWLPVIPKVVLMSVRRIAVVADEMRVPVPAGPLMKSWTETADDVESGS
jgi:hypothetical protein